MRKIYLFITAAMLLCSSSLWAATNVATVTIDGESTSYTKMSSAVNAWKAATAATLKLETDVTYTSGISIAAGKTLVLDLNGKALTMNNAKQTSINDAGSSLTIKNGTLTVNNTYAANVARGINLSSSASLNMEDVVYVFNSDAEGDFAKYGIYNTASTCSVSLNNTSVSASSSIGSTYGLYSKGGVSAEEGSTISSSSIAGIAYGLYLYKTANATVSGSTVSASASQNKAYGIYSAGTSIITNESAVSASTTTGDVYGLYATLTSSISKSAVSAVTGTGKAYGVYTGKSCNLSLDNPSISASVSTSGNAYGFYANKAITITNGTYASNNYCAVYNTIYIEGGMFDGDVLIYSGGITGGVFTEVPTAACVADDKMAEYNAQTGYYEVVDNDVVVATVGGVDYTNLREALYASSEETPAILSRDLTRNNAVALDEPHDIYLDLNGKTISGSNTVFCVTSCKLNVVGAGKVSVSSTNAVVNLYGSVDSSKQNYSVLNMGSNVIFEAPNGWGVAIFSEDYPSGQSRDKAFGAVANINGTINASSGITINGYVAQTNGNVPMININDGAILNCDNDMACVYAGGYGVWNIGAATLTAGTPIYAKAGNINVEGATITANGEYAEPVPNSNGFNATGDGILIDSKEGYAGNVILSVSGETVITSENGYAIQEALTDMDETTAIGLTIESGSFAGAKGTVKLSDEFATALKDGSTASGNWTLNAVTGGKYSAKPEVVADGYEVVELSDAYPFLYGVQETTSTSYTTAYFDDTEYESFTVAKGYEYIVKTGETIKVGTLTIGDDASYPARVRVQPGGVLIVGSVIMNNSKGAESLLLESNANGYGNLLFNSTSPSSTLGTVEMYSHARILDSENGKYLFQHFGLPVNSEGAKITKNIPAAYSAWNVKSGWAYVNSSVVLSNGPWSGSNETPNSLYAGSMFSFSGSLVGNSNAEYSFSSSEYGYKCFANSYTAPISMKGLIDEYINGIGNKGDGTIWVFKASDYEKAGENFVQYVYADVENSDVALDPLQAFFALHASVSDDSFTVSYDDVYNFNTGESVGTKDASAVTIENQGYISVSDGSATATLKLFESDDLSDSFDLRYDGYQMETGNLQIYITQGGENYSAFGTNSFEGKEITILSKDGTDITMSFSNLKGKAFKLIDLNSGAEVKVGSSETYKFTVDANTTAVRFRLGEGEVAAEEYEANANVKIWSNNGTLYVSNNDAEADIEIINLSGAKVVSAKANGEAIQQISISDLANGVYVVRVGAATAKIIK